MMLCAIPTRKAGHDSQGTCIDRRRIALCMLGDQFRLAYACVTLIAPIHRAAIGKEMLGSGGHPLRV